jgi:hypothetical protein
MDDYSLVSKYKGLTNEDLQIKAFFNEDENRIICASESHEVFVWRTGKFFFKS